MGPIQPQQHAEFWAAVISRDKAFEGKFIFAVLSTGVFCRPGCPSRTPRQENVRFFSDGGAAAQAGFRPCRRCRPDEPALQAVETICAYIKAHLEEPLSLQKLSEVSGLSPFHLQRKFKAALGITPRQFAEHERMLRLKSAIRDGSSVTDAIYEAGFSSSSRVYERTNSQLGMTPATYGKAGAHQTVYFAVQPTALGLLLVAATATGVCSIQFGDSADDLVASLRREFARATLVPDLERVHPHLQQLAVWLEGQKFPLDLPLDLRASAFQRRVWDYLQRIPYGTTRSYAEIAAGLGSPHATRAVARACATNPVALAIPCHRVIRQDGKLAGYRWGIGRKESLLKLESEHKLNPEE